MNRVQRRLWRVLISMGVDTGDPAVAIQLGRLIDSHVSVMTPALRHVMPSVLSGAGDVDYVQLAREIVTVEGVRISPAALRKRVSRALMQIETAIRQAKWDHAGSVPHLDLSGRPPATEPPAQATASVPAAPAGSAKPPSDPLSGRD